MEDVIKFLEDCVDSYRRKWEEDKINYRSNYTMAKAVVEAEELLMRARKVQYELKEKVPNIK